MSHFVCMPRYLIKLKQKYWIIFEPYSKSSKRWQDSKKIQMINCTRRFLLGASSLWNIYLSNNHLVTIAEKKDCNISALIWLQKILWDWKQPRSNNGIKRPAWMWHFILSHSYKIFAIAIDNRLQLCWFLPIYGWL